MRAVVGLALFCQYWFWQPYILFASLAMTPTAVIAMDSKLNRVPLRFKSNVAPSQFAYPPGMKPPERATKAKGPTAVLSYGHGKTQKKKSGEQASKDKEKKEGEKKEEKAAPAAAAAAAAAAVAEVKKPKEPSFEILDSPARVTLRQCAYLSFDVDDKYTPVKTGPILGFTIVREKNPQPSMTDGEPAATPSGAPDSSATASSAASAAAAAAAKTDDQDDEVVAPQPFELPQLQ